MNKAEDCEKVQEDTPVSEPLSVAQKMLLGLAIVPKHLGDLTVKQFGKPTYNILFGISPGHIGSLFAVMNIWDTINDPIVAKITDNTHTSWGRRRPYIAVGGALMGLMLPALFMLSPDWGTWTKLGYLLGMFMLFNVFHSFYSIAFGAMVVEFTSDYKEKTKIRGYTSVFGYLKQTFTPWLFPMALWLNAIIGGEIWGARIVVIILGIMIFSISILVGVKLKDNTFDPMQTKSEHACAHKRIDFFPSLRSFSKDKTFWKFITLNLCLQVPFLLVSFLNQYIIMFYVFKGDLLKGASVEAVSMNLGIFTGILSIVIISKYFADMDKKKLLGILLAVTMLLASSKWFLLNPDLPYLCLIIYILWAPASAAFHMVFQSMQTDFCEYDEWKTGEKRVAIFLAVTGWITKSGATIGILMSGWLLVLSGFDKDLGGDQSVTTFLQMRVFIVVIPTLGLLVGLITLYFYPLNKKCMLEIKKDLDQRHADTINQS